MFPYPSGAPAGEFSVPNLINPMNRFFPACRVTVSAALVSTAGFSFGQAPANDSFAAAIPLTLNAVMAGTNVNATVQTGEPATHFQNTAAAATGAATGKSVWYSYLPDADALATFTVVAQGTGTTAAALHAAAYSGTSLANLVRVASASSTAGAAGTAGTAFAGNLFALKTGEPVFIQVTGNNATAAAPFDLKLSSYARPGKIVLPRYSNWEWLHPLDGADPGVSPAWNDTWKIPGDATDYGTAPAVVAFSAPRPGPFGFAAMDGAPGIKTDIGTPASVAADSISNSAAYFRSSFTLAAATSNLWAEVLADDGAYIYIDDLPGIPVHIAAKLAPASFNGAAAWNTAFQDYRPQPDTFLTGAIPAAASTSVPGCRAYVPAGFNQERQTKMVYLGGLTGKLDAGTHRIAVSLHQSLASSSDMAFDLQLIDMGAYPLAGGAGGIAFTETNYTAGSTTAAVVPAAEHHFAPNAGQADLAWYCVTPDASTRHGFVISDTSSGSQKALMIREAKDSMVYTEPVNVEGLSQFVVSLRILTRDTSSGFEAADGFRVFLETSDDGVSFAEPVSPLEIVPQLFDDEAFTPFSTGFVSRALTVTSNPYKFVRAVISASTDSANEYIYFDDIRFSQCQLFASAGNIVYNNGSDNDRSNDTVTFDLEVTASGNTGNTWTTSGFGAGNEISGTIGGPKVSITRPAADAAGVRQNVVFSVADDGDPACRSTVTVNTPAAAIGTISLTNVVRNSGADPATTADDTFTCDIRVDGTATGFSYEVRSSDAGNTTLYGSGNYGEATPVSIPGGVTSVTIRDNSLTTLTKASSFPPAGIDLAMGRVVLNGTNRILYSNPAAAAPVFSEWRQSTGTGITPAPADLGLTVDETTTMLHPAAVMAPLDKGILESPMVDVAGIAGVRVTAALRAFESSTGSGFEAADTFKIEVIEERTGGETSVNLLQNDPADLTPKNDLLNGFDAASAAAYDADRARDEFNREGAGAAEHSRGTFLFNYTVPADVQRLRVKITAANDSTVEYFFVQNLLITDEANPDLDGDFLPDAWEITYFGSTAQNGTGDFDGDGQSNAAELAAGTVPNDGKSVFGITGISRGGNLVDITFSSVSGKRYLVQHSPAPGTPWTDSGTAVTADSGSTTIAGIPDAAAASHFFRVKLVP